MAWTDPIWLLLLTTLLLIASLVLSRRRARWPLWLRTLAQLALLIVMTLLVRRILGSPLEPQFSRTNVGERFWQQLIEASWWIIAARWASGLTRLFIFLESRPRETRIVSDLLVGVIVVTTILAIINFAFRVPIGTLLATSGVIAIVLGLALQNTLSDVFSGIAVGIERPYEPGDAIWVEGGVEGQVIEVNWRSTHIATMDQNIAVIPNSVIAKARLVNRSRPSPLRSTSVTVALDSRTVPEHGREALIAALRSCCLISAEPAPWVACTELKGDGVSWEVGFCVDRAGLLAGAKTEVLWQIHRHLRHAGIGLAVAGSANAVASSVPDLTQLLQASDLFGQMDTANRAVLAQHFQRTHFEAGDTLIREGEAPELAFLLASGTAEITAATPAGPRVVYRISPGETLGAVGLAMGSPHPATATALTNLIAYCIDKAGLAAAIAERLELKETMEQLVTKARASSHPEAVIASNPEEAKPDLFLDRLKSFLRALESSPGT
jgi:small-conductance mechanosensitive channel/CRP-like cAMP-binding protein